MVEAFLDPIAIDEDALAFSAMRGGRAGRPLLRRRSTPSRASGPRSTSRCSRTGGTTRRGRRRARPQRPGKANRIWKELLAAYEPPPMDPAHPRGARRVRRPPQGRGRRPDGLLTAEGRVKSSAQVVVIGGGVVGASVLYHLTKAGWTDVLLLERRELTAGSTWHAAGGMHTLNGDPNVARLQQYTIQLYEEIEKESGQDCSIHLPGGLMLASDETRMDFLRMAVARGRYLGMQLEMISRERGPRPLPAARPAVLRRRAVRPRRGPRRPDRRHPGLRQVRPAGRRRGPPAHAGDGALSQRPDGTWDVHIENGDPIHAEHVVNAGGLWAREVGRFVGIELPVLAMEHHYLLTDEHARGRRVRRADRPRDADGARLRRRDLHPPGRRGDAPRHVRAGLPAVVAAGDAVGLRVAAAEAGPRADHAGAVRSRSSTTRRWARSASSGSSTGRSRSRPTATRSSGRSAACAATGSPAASWPGCRRAAASGSRSRRG